MTLFIRRARAAAFLLAVGGTIAILPRPASAQPAASAADLESARELILKGRELRDKGDLPGALDKLKAAHALAHTPITGIELARTHVALKQPLEARDVCLQIGRMPVTREETQRSKEARDEAAKIADEMRPKIATLSVSVRTPKDRIAQVRVDGVEVPPAALDSRKVNPGKHAVSARIDDGPEATTEVTVGEGETRSVALEPTAPAIAKTGPGPGPTTGPVYEKLDEFVTEKRTSPLVPIGFVVAGAGVAVGTITGIVALGKKNDLGCGATKECTDPGDQDTLRSAKTMADVSTVAFVVGGVGAAVGIVGLFTPSTVRVRKGDLSITPYVAGAGAGLHGTF